METRYITTSTIPNGLSSTRLNVRLLQRHRSFFSSPILFSAINETSLYPPDNSYQVHRISRSQPISINTHSIQPVSRPLSSADESGPVPKKLRSTSRQPEVPKSKPIKSSLDDPLKKARARPALSFANIFSFSGSQSTTSSRANPPPGKNNTQPTAGVGTRRSTRLLSGTGTKSHSSKVICSICSRETSSCYSILFLAPFHSRSTATAPFPKFIDRVRQGRRCHTQCRRGIFTFTTLCCTLPPV